jgi:signal transduction histidine kinase
LIKALSAFTRRFSGWFAAAVCLSAAALVWIGYQALVEWERTGTLVATRRAEAAADLLAGAFAKDMRGAQEVVLAEAERDGSAAGLEIDLLHPVASAFARYPYPEAFFSWRGEGTSQPVTFFARADRRPAWLGNERSLKLFPVVLGANGALAGRLMRRVAEDAALCRRVSAFDLDAGESKYQVVSAIMYTDAQCGSVSAVFGFMVSLDWVRRFYFKDLTEQVSRLAADDRSIALTVVDQANVLIAGEAGASHAPQASRPFPLAFFDPNIFALDPPRDFQRVNWSAVATAENDPTFVAAEAGARRTLAVAAVMTVVLAAALLLGFRAARASAALAEMRSEFVSTVTHELKTPLANIRALNETLASGKGDASMSREYALLAVDEAKRLTRLVDNLLAYAKIADAADVYSFEPVLVDAAIRRALQEFAPPLSQAGFETRLDVAPDLPAVWADVSALGLVLNNLIDNSIRYASPEHRSLAIRAARDGDGVVLEVADRGVGIPADELPSVTRKFFHGRGSHTGGSGLGLSIVDRIVSDHHGSLEIRSDVGMGTTVVVRLPIARAA